MRCTIINRTHLHIEWIPPKVHVAVEPDVHAGDELDDRPVGGLVLAHEDVVVVLPCDHLSVHVDEFRSPEAGAEKILWDEQGGEGGGHANAGIEPKSEGILVKIFALYIRRSGISLGICLSHGVISQELNQLQFDLTLYFQ